MLRQAPSALGSIAHPAEQSGGPAWSCMQRSRGSQAQGFLLAARSASAAALCSAGMCVPTTKRLRRSALLATYSRGSIADEGAAALSRPYLSCMVSAHRPALQMDHDCSTRRLLHPLAMEVATACRVGSRPQLVPCGHKRSMGQPVRGRMTSGITPGLMDHRWSHIRPAATQMLSSL